MYQICFANMLQIHISDTIMYTLAEMNVSNMYYIFDTKLTFLVVYTERTTNQITTVRDSEWLAHAHKDLVHRYQALFFLSR